MTKKLFVIVATVLTYLWAGAVTTEAADFKTLDGTWEGLLTVNPGPGIAAPVTVNLTTRGAKHITGKITFTVVIPVPQPPPNDTLTLTFDGNLDGYTIEKTVFFIRSVLPAPANFTCPNDFKPVTGVLQGIASIDDMNPMVQIVTQSGIGNCGDGLIVIMTLNKKT